MLESFFFRIDLFNFEILDFPQDATSLFENLKALQTLILSSSRICRFPSHVYDGILQCATEMKNLKCLEIDRRYSDLSGYGQLDLSPLGCLTSLESLSLPSLPECTKELVGLDQLLQLIELNLTYSGGLLLLPNFDTLPNLRRICVAECTHLKHPDDQFKHFQKFHSKFHVDHQCLRTCLSEFRPSRHQESSLLEEMFFEIVVNY